jgi:hypothetical protein
VSKDGLVAADTGALAAIQRRDHASLMATSKRCHEADDVSTKADRGRLGIFIESGQ